MSLDISLYSKNPITKSGTGVFVRENGQTVELSSTECENRGWDVRGTNYQTTEVFEWNITHNLGTMAGAVVIDQHTLYQYLWRPDEIGIDRAGQLIDPLIRGLQILIADRDRLIEFNPDNGWGSYEGLIECVEHYLMACIKYPESIVKVSR